MSEVFVSPGVYVRERDFSYYVSSVGNSSLALVGETKKGPAFLPTLVKNMSEFREKFGNMDPNKLVGYAAKSYFKYANSAYVVRVLGNDALRPSGTELLTFVVQGTSEKLVAATLLCDGLTVANTVKIESGKTSIQSFRMTADTIYTGSVNLYDTNAADYIGTLFPRGTTVAASANAMALQHIFPLTIARGLTLTGSTAAMPTYSAWTGASVQISDTALNITGYSKASSPLIVANVPDTTNAGTGLFTVHTISDGIDANSIIKIGIENINTANTTFYIVVRDYADTNASQIVLERFAKCTMDPTSDDYILKQIGDSRDETGNFKLVSGYIYIEAESGDHTGLVPYGWNGTTIPSATTFASFAGSAVFPQYSCTTAYATTTSISRQYLGLDYVNTDPDLLMIGNGSAWDKDLGGQARKGFHLNSGANTTLYATGPSAITSYATTHAKFLVPVFGGRDGWVYSAATRDLLTNDPTASQITQWDAALDTLRNPEEYDINLLAVPGVDLTCSIGTYAQELAEERADCLYIGDMPSGKTSSSQAAAVTLPDSSYACTYWPYVKIYDSDNSQDVYIPPTPQALEALAYTDSAAFPWYAPAGMNRGLLTDVIRAQYRLTAADRETLYNAKINPIATFPGQGITIWGQKTLQTRPTALDRINVRRMMLYIEKVIAGASKYLVFEQNDVNTWNRFKGMVQPIMDIVKINRGLYDFRVIMDETTNTPDMIDRNQMVGQIYVKPTKTAEAILVNFNILASGAEFSES